MRVSTLSVAVGCAFFWLARVQAADGLSPAARAQRDFEQAQAAHRAQPTNIQAAVTFARAAFDRAEFALKDSERAAIAEAGIEAARRALSRAPNHGAAHYWLAMNLGQLARTKSLGALRLIRDIEQHFQRARELDEQIDYAGPDRGLGFLYRDAPGWPTSVGNKKKARQHFERAVELAPEFPENQLALAEAYEQWDERENFQRQLRATESALEKARRKFTGEQWETMWEDWERRLKKLTASRHAD